jgi:uncharacterized membrane protein
MQKTQRSAAEQAQIELETLWQESVSLMIPFFILVISILLLRLLGVVGVHWFHSWTICLRGGLAVMFFFTAASHWGRRREDLVAMVPPVLPYPHVIVSLTGVLEILGAIGLLIPKTATAAAVCLTILLIAMFPANVRAALENLSISGRPATPLTLRTLLQVVFISALLLAGFSRH